VSDLTRPATSDSQRIGRHGCYNDLGAKLVHRLRTERSLAPRSAITSSVALRVAQEAEEVSDVVDAVNP
jgi:hypothetical protein